MVKDNVKCCNCGFDGLVNLGEETCLSCNQERFLSWKDGELQEVEV